MTALDDIRLGPNPNQVVSDLAPAEAQHLAPAVEAALLEIPEAMLKPVTQPGSRFVFQPRMLLGLLLFWYARQVYDSKTIVAELRCDLARCHLPLEHVPDTELLRRFRAENRAVLHGCLTTVLRSLAQAKMALGIIAHLSERQIAEEASRRIIMAMFVDSIESDTESPAREGPSEYFTVAKE